MFSGMFKVCTSPSLRSDYTDEITLGDVFGEINAEVDPDNHDSVIRIYGTNFVSRQGQVWATNLAGSIVQYEPSTNWIIPNNLAAAEDWYARFTNLTGDTGFLTGNAVDTWVQLSTANAEIRLLEPSGTGVQYTVTGNVELRIGSTGPGEYSGTILMVSETSEYTGGQK